MSGRNFRTLPFPMLLMTGELDQQRYIGCKVRWRRGTTVVDGILEDIDRYCINIAGIPSIRYNTSTDVLFWDADGQQPKELFSEEVKNLAVIIYESRNKHVNPGAPSWVRLDARTAEKYYNVAEDVLNYIDTRKCAACRDTTCSLCSRVNCPRDCQNRGKTC